MSGKGSKLASSNNSWRARWCELQASSGKRQRSENRAAEGAGIAQHPAARFNLMVKIVEVGVEG